MIKDLITMTDYIFKNGLNSNQHPSFFIKSYYKLVDIKNMLNKFRDNIISLNFSTSNETFSEKAYKFNDISLNYLNQDIQDYLEILEMFSKKPSEIPLVIIESPIIWDIYQKEIYNKIKNNYRILISKNSILSYYENQLLIEIDLFKSNFRKDLLNDINKELKIIKEQIEILKQFIVENYTIKDILIY